LQAQIASLNPAVRPSEPALLNKFCASLRPDLKRYLQEKRIDHPDYSISQLVQAASVRESSLRGPTVPNLNTMDGRRDSGKPGGTKADGKSDKDRKWCFFLQEQPSQC
jgi:hypothetical protein